VKDLLPFILFLVIVIGLLGFSARTRRRQATRAAERSGQIGPGSQVMTTSGLYGTVVARNDDDTVLLSIAPGVEVKWAVAAIRDVDSLPNQYRRGDPRPEPGTGPPGIRLDKPDDESGPDPRA
jgi:preprotein translocase subunit YajC